MSDAKLIERYFDTFFQGPARHADVRSWLSDDFVFTGPLMSAENADEYVQQLTAMGDELELYADIRKMVSEGDTVAVLVDFKSPAGVIPYAQWFQIREGKIARLEVIYDPRLFLEMDS
jgi:ketosteroid isomerase-like protein